jgi:hypothetical protein
VQNCAKLNVFPLNAQLSDGVARCNDIKDEAGDYDRREHTGNDSN